MRPVLKLCSMRYLKFFHFVETYINMTYGRVSNVKLSEFCCDGKTAGGPLLCLYSLQSSLAASLPPLARIFMHVYVEEKKDREGKRMGTGISTSLHSAYVCVCWCVFVIPPMAD